MYKGHQVPARATEVIAGPSTQPAQRLPAQDAGFAAGQLHRLTGWAQQLPAYRSSEFAVQHVNNTIHQDGCWNRILAHSAIADLFPTIHALQQDGVGVWIDREVADYLPLADYVCVIALCVKDVVEAIIHEVRVQGVRRQLLRVDLEMVRGILARTHGFIVGWPRGLRRLYAWGSSGGALAQWHALPMSLRALSLGLLVVRLVDGRVNALTVLIVMFGTTGLMGYWL